jgi:hypothetical protein
MCNFTSNRQDTQLDKQTKTLTVRARDEAIKENLRVLNFLPNRSTQPRVRSAVIEPTASYFIQPLSIS